MYLTAILALVGQFDENRNVVVHEGKRFASSTIMLKAVLTAALVFMYLLAPGPVDFFVLLFVFTSIRPST